MPRTSQRAALRRQQRKNRLKAPRFVASSAKIVSTRHVSSPAAQKSLQRATFRRQWHNCRHYKRYFGATNASRGGFSRRRKSGSDSPFVCPTFETSLWTRPQALRGATESSWRGKLFQFRSSQACSSCVSPRQPSPSRRTRGHTKVDTSRSALGSKDASREGAKVCLRKYPEGRRAR